MGMNNSMLALTCKFAAPVPPSRLELVLHGYSSAYGSTDPQQLDWQEDEFVDGMMKLYQLWLRRSAYFLLTLLASIPAATCLVDAAMSELQNQPRDTTLASTASAQPRLASLPVFSECQSAIYNNALPTLPTLSRTYAPTRRRA